MKDETVKLTIDVGEPARTFAMGDYLNAIDELTCYVVEKREEFDVAGALRMYADHVDAESLRAKP